MGDVHHLAGNTAGAQPSASVHREGGLMKKRYFKLDDHTTLISTFDSPSWGGGVEFMEVVVARKVEHYEKLAEVRGT